MLRWWKTFLLIESDILASRVVVKKITLWMKDIAWCRESWCLLLSFFCRCCHAPHQPPMAKFFSLHKLKMYSRTVRDCCSEAFLWINVLYVFLYRLKNKPEKQEPPLTSQKNEETKPGKKKQRKQNNTQESTAQKLSFWWSNSVTTEEFFPGNALKVRCALSKINTKGKHGIYLPEFTEFILFGLRLVGWAPDFNHWVTLLFKCLHFRTLQLTMWVGQQTVQR